MKKHMMKGLWTAGCAAALLLGLLLSVSVSATGGDEVVFVVVDERFMDLSAATMPVRRGGTYYVPYTVFDYGTCGVNLGVRVAPQPGSNRLTLFNKTTSISFYTDSQTIVDNNTGEVCPYTTFLRNGLVYVPAYFTAECFGLGYSQLSTEYGDVLRIQSPAVVLSNKQLLEAAENTLSTRRAEYLKSIAPSPSATQTEMVTPPPRPGVTETPSAERKREVCLAFLHTEQGDGERILDLLEQRGGRYGLFLFRPEDLAENADTVRRIVGSGHSIGLWVTDGEQAEEGNRLLEQIARTRTRIVYADGEKRYTEALEREDWICWQGNVNGVPGETTTASGLYQRVLRSVEGRRADALITMDDSEISALALPQLLRGLEQEGCELRRPVETVL